MINAHGTMHIVIIEMGMPGAAPEKILIGPTNAIGVTVKKNVQKVEISTKQKCPKTPN